MPPHVGFVGVQHRVDEVKANRGVWCMILSSTEMVKDEVGCKADQCIAVRQVWSVRN